MKSTSKKKPAPKKREKKLKPSDFKALMLRTCNADMTAYGGFQWPSKGWVKPQKWNPDPVCGDGLHGALWGEGDGPLFKWDADAKWMVCGINTWVDLGGKVKTPEAYVLFAGTRKDATDYLALHGGAGRVIIGGTATAGYGGTATAGHRGTATAGHRGTATAGDGGTATAGDDGTATAGHRGTATAGHRGTATAGHRGTATAGDDGTATAGDGGTATAGHRGTATAGDDGTATAGDGGILSIRWWDGNGNRHRIAVGYVGEDGIEANKPYRVDNHGKFIPA